MQPINSNTTQPGQMPADSLTPQPGPVWKTQTLNILDNPLRVLQSEQGLSEEELLDLALRLKPDCPRSEMQAMLRSLQSKQGILVPVWWKGSPQEFQKQMSDSLIAMRFKPGSPMALKQSNVLEALLNMWDELP